MKIDRQDIKTILESYNISEKIEGLEYIIEYYSEDRKRSKVIVKVDTDKSPYIVKFIIEDEHPMELIEEQSIFSEQIRENGINTARRYKSKDRYTSIFIKDKIEYAVTVEDYIGKEIKTINEEVVKDIASLMAKMHTISEKNNYSIANDTIWNIFSDTSDITRGYRAFCGYGISKKYDFSKYNIDLYNKIIDLYNRRLSRLRSKWSLLPSYASQGDYSTNNMVYKDGEIGIFDYNIAGDVVLVSDMLIEGYFVAYEMKLDKELDNKARARLFVLFVKEYTRYRKLNSLEIEVLDDIYAIVSSFWWSRIIYDDNSLRACLREGDRVKVNNFLEETYRLVKNDFKIQNFIANNT